MKKAKIKSLSVYLPERIVNNEEIEQRVSFDHSPIGKGLISKAYGGKARFFADKQIQVSDMAVEAALQLLRLESKPVDLLIFAAASSDLIEPATANIIQTKLQLQCPAMDVKNACNSFVSAIHIASAYIQAGIYNNILITCGEKLSEVINFNPRDHDHLMKCFAGYSLGDGGAAMIISASEGSEIMYQRFNSWGEHWELCTVEGGGSRAFRDPEKYFFEGRTWGMRDVFVEKGVPFINECFVEAGWEKSDLDCVITHQVSNSTPSFISSHLGIPVEKFVNTFQKYGNTAAASIPLTLYEAVESGMIIKGSKVMILGLAAGISISVQFLIW